MNNDWITYGEHGHHYVAWCKHNERDPGDADTLTDYSDRVLDGCFSSYEMANIEEWLIAKHDIDMPGYV